MLINLRCAHETFVTAEGSVGGAVNANRAVAAEWELFGLCDQFGIPLVASPNSHDRVTIRAKPGHIESRMLYPKWSAGTVRADALTPAGASFAILKVGGAGDRISDGDRVAFRSPQKISRFPFDPSPAWGWLTAEPQDAKPVVCDRRRDDPGGWEVFTFRQRQSSIPIVDQRARMTQTPSHASAFQMTAQQYQERVDVLAEDGYRPLWVHVSPAPFGAAQYAAIWVRNRAQIAWRARHGMDTATLDADHARNESDGLALVCLSGYPSPQGTRYAAIWWTRELGVDTRYVRDVSGDVYQTDFDARRAEGFMPICVTAWPDGNAARYAAVFRRPAAPTWFARHGISSTEHQALFSTPPVTGARPLAVAGARVASNDQISSVFVADGVECHARHDLSDGELHMESLRRGARGLDPTSLSGYGSGATSRYTGVWIRKRRRFIASGPESVTAAFTQACDDRVRDFMQPRGIRGLMLAAAVDDKLVLARGYSNDTGEEPPIKPTSLARIASISKTITAVATFKLIEDGQLDLDETMMSILNLDRGSSPPQGADIRAITVRHLLQHLGGWRFTEATDAPAPDAVDHLDPMYLDPLIATRLAKPLPITRRDIIAFMTKFRRVDNTPGTAYSYSNYGYCLLGRIIEAKSGQEYRRFVEDRVLGPLGLLQMQLGKSKFNRRAAGEVAYYTRGVGLAASVLDSARRPVMQAYGGFNLENTDAHGGWLASAVDLTRFAVAFQRKPPTSVLRQDTIKLMLTPSAAKDDYACGWRLRDDGSHGHDGTLPGTWSQMRSNWSTRLDQARSLGPRRVCYAILATSRSPNGDLPFDADGVQEFLSDRNLLPDHPWNTIGLIEGIVKNLMPDPTAISALTFP